MIELSKDTSNFGPGYSARVNGELWYVVRRGKGWKIRWPDGTWTHGIKNLGEARSYLETVTKPLPDDEEPDREPSAEQEQAWNEQYNGTSLGS